MTSLDASALLVLERAYIHWHTSGEWPQRELLQRQFAAERADVNVREAAASADGYLNMISPEEHVQLTLRGLSLLPDARPLLEAYVRAVRVMLDRYRDTELAATFGSDDLKALGLDPRLERELSELLRADHWALGSGGGGDEEWSYQIADRVMAADNIESVEDLLKVRFGDSQDSEEKPDKRTPEPLSSASGATPAFDADRPIETLAEDLLDRGPLAQMLADRATRQFGQGFVMGVAGTWGSGKTSLLNLMVGAIKQSETGYVVRFDPWLFSSSEELVLRFMREVQAQLGRHGQLGEAATRIGEYAEILAPLSTAAHGPLLAASMTASGMLARRRLKRRTRVSAQEQREKVAKVLRKLDLRLVVVIDDLDRLMHDEIRDVVRLVKLVADFPNTTYVLAYDQPRVACALGDGVEQDGHEFLEKIVQITHEVPPVHSVSLSRVLATSISAAVGDLSDYRFDASLYANLFVHAENLFASVRDIRRFTNVIPGTLALTGKEVELADVLAIEALRVRVPASFALIVAASAALTQPAGGLARQGDDAAREQVEAIIAAAGKYADDVAELIKILFPAAARHLGGMSYGREWLGTWRKAARIAHPEVLDIYLAKSLPPGALPTEVVESTLKNLENEPALIAMLNALDDEQLETLLQRLEHYEDAFGSTRPEVAIAVLFNQHRRLERPKRYALDIGAEHRVPRVVLRLLRNRDPAEVAQIVEAALPKIRTLSERGHLIRMVGYSENSGHELVSRDHAARLETRFLEELISTEASALAAEADILPLLFWAQQERPEETRARVEHLIVDDDFLLALLGAALRETVSQAIGEAAVHRTQEFGWDTLTALVDERLLIERVRQLNTPITWPRLTEHTALALRCALDRIAPRNGR